MLRQFLTESDTDEIVAPPNAERVNILVVDDLPEKILVYRAILEELGQNLVTVNSGQEALKQVLRQEFAVILLDVNMPGMSGFEMVEQAKLMQPEVSVLFMTGNPQEGEFEVDVRAGELVPTPLRRNKVQVIARASRPAG